MLTNRQSGWVFRPSLHLVLLLAFLLTLLVAGGASRADAAAQFIVRGVSALILVALILVGERPSFQWAKPVLFLLIASLALVLMQVVPLPPDVWQMMPARAALAEGMAVSGGEQAWRTWSIAPSATINAAGSLLVPATTLFLIVGLKPSERSLLPSLFLSMAATSMLAGLMQLSGVGLKNPLINQAPGQISGMFANRNHLALLLAAGCLLVPVWTFLDNRQTKWRVPVALGLALLFPLTIVASGSRAGALLGILALGLGPILARHQIKKALQRYPRWAFPALVSAFLVTVGCFVLVSVGAGRALSIDRVIENDPGQDMRARGLPTVLNMGKEHFFTGSGFGSFDPIFRMYEPFSLLKPTYFNHAHNDWLEVFLDAGVPGLVLIGAALLWWGWASVRVWCTERRSHGPLPRLGSAILLFIFIASIFDYPARTPLIMAILVIAGLWLSEAVARSDRPALPRFDQHL